MTNPTAKNIANTVATLEEAIEAAKEMGNDIFAGYTNCIKDHKRIDLSMGVAEYFVMETAEIFYICEFQEQKMLNTVSLGSSLTSGPLCKAFFGHDTIHFSTAALVNKGDNAARNKACAEGFLLTDPDMANAPKVYNY